ncbi:hypothetical protein AGR9A_Lc40584 [Agrobacterium salinitolerans str. Hayward 0363]|nr:hypothetical protein AGR9A_Lc40584 [Agrobacterium salinitolerans str. Hayward 0363]
MGLEICLVSKRALPANRHVRSKPPPGFAPARHSGFDGSADATMVMQSVPKAAAAIVFIVIRIIDLSHSSLRPGGPQCSHQSSTTGTVVGYRRRRGIPPRVDLFSPLKSTRGK